MKLTHFAQALTLALVAATAYLAWMGQEESAKANAKMDLLAQRQAAQMAQQTIQMPADAVPPPLTPAPAEAAAPSLAADSTGKLLPEPMPSLPLATDKPKASAASPAPRTITAAPVPTPEPTAPATASADATTLSAPAGAPSASAPATPGQPAPLTPLQRRIMNAPSIAKVVAVVKEHGFITLNAGSTKGLRAGSKFDLRRGNGVVARIDISDVDTNESIANVDPKSIPPGVEVQAGDEVIQVLH